MISNFIYKFSDTGVGLAGDAVREPVRLQQRHVAAGAGLWRHVRGAHDRHAPQAHGAGAACRRLRKMVQSHDR